MKIEIPLRPPSVNHYKGVTRTGRWYVKPEGLAFKAAVAQIARGDTVAPELEKDRRTARYSLTARVFLGPKQRGDGDNFWKCIADGLVEAGVIHSDAAVSEWHMYVNGDERSEARTEIEVFRICA